MSEKVRNISTKNIGVYRRCNLLCIVHAVRFAFLDVA
jgi:hypothetical protein